MAHQTNNVKQFLDKAGVEALWERIYNGFAPRWQSYKPSNTASSDNDKLPADFINTYTSDYIVNGEKTDASTLVSGINCSICPTVAVKEISIYDKHCLSLSKEEVEEKLAAGIPYVIRQNNPTEGTTTFADEIYGDITVDNAELDDMILIKSDGYPTYNFANVVDDHLMGITHVVRGNEYLSSSPKYVRLYDAFGWDVPVYVHLPLITDENAVAVWTIVIPRFWPNVMFA